ncbi:phosphate transport system regulatory protein PhoU [Chloroflexus islandicus]|uniref:Phosphate-specific transport system accessory protein PhoU n=1 Tax=Chloroflexus islandicus TaxID=1707952 RepID=A0A178MA65_9CHLR|nr:phosphate signaling complex protein PhoU [Chloroflexus islandicus]OAN44925.1 phosphate transport system regulatory protein PhoU [Chloroflexus islandicus]
MRPREHFDQALDALRKQVVEMGRAVSVALEQAITALERGDVELAKAVVTGDTTLNAAKDAIEQQAVNLIATQQPVARDLRRIVAAIAMSYELERIADYAKSTAKMVIGSPDPNRGPLAAPAELVVLGKTARANLDRTLAALANGGADAIKDIIAHEDEIDHEYKQLKRTLVAKLTPPETADLLFIAHNFERVSDRALNMAEKIIFISSGDQVELND